MSKKVDLTYFFLLAVKMKIEMQNLVMIFFRPSYDIGKKDAILVSLVVCVHK
jgi:hypothetical protein